jgi:hypothetical protein
MSDLFGPDGALARFTRAANGIHAVAEQLRAQRATEEDREAAVDLAHALGMSADQFTSGGGDILVRHFSAFRANLLNKHERERGRP